MDLISEAGEAGWECAVMDLAAYFSQPFTRAAAEAFTRDVERAVVAIRPDVTFSMWSNVLSMLVHMRDEDGNVSTLFDRLGVPHVCYWLDAPHWAQNRTLANLLPNPVFRSRMTFHIVNNAATADEMQRVLGFGATAAVPYGIRAQSHQLEHPVSAKRVKPFFDAVVSVGPGDPPPGAQALEELKSDAPDIHAVRVEAAQRIRAKLLNQHTKHRCLQAACNVSEWSVLVEDLINDQLQRGHDEDMLSRIELLGASPSHGPALAMLSDPKCYITVTGLLREVEASLRAFTVTWLSMRHSMGVFGGGALGNLGWPCRATDLGDVPYESMAACYALGAVSLTIMRWQDDRGLNLKPFEITAAGGVLLNARRRGFDECFEEGVEGLQFSSPLECQQKLIELLQNPSLRDEIAQRGHSRTLNTHLWRHRVPAYEALLTQTVGK